MRDEPTPEETAAISRVRAALTKQGYSVGPDVREKKDDPDWVFELNGRRIAADCRALELEAYHKWLAVTNKVAPGDAWSVTVPLEPHLWVRHALDEKKHKVAHYMSKSGAEEVWLILHGGWFLWHPDQREVGMIMAMTAMAAEAKDSGFSAIWLTDRQDTFRAWKLGDPILPFPQYPRGPPIVTISRHNVQASSATGYVCKVDVSEDKVTNSKTIPSGDPKAELPR